MDRSGLETDSKSNDVAIVGIGCLFPKASGVGHYWANIKHGVDCISDVPSTHWNPDEYFDSDPKSPDMTYARRGGFLDAVDFNPMEFGIAPRDLEATDTTQLLGLVAAKQALIDSKIEFLPPNGKPDGKTKAVARNRCSIILGVTGTLELVVPLGARLGHPHWRKALNDSGVPKQIADEVVERIGDSYVSWQENSFPGLLGNVVAGRIANRLDLHGTNCVVDAACASSLSAVHLAMMELNTGRADVVVSGGTDTFNDIFMYMCFSKTPALSPTGNSKPFDANGDGTILGEGLGVVVLKRRADAERDGDRIYAVIKAVGTSSDGKGNAIYAPSADGQMRCIRNAHKLANVTPDTIELIEAHGTGTKVGDGVEATALSDVFKNDSKNPPMAPWCALGSVKSQIGHTKAAAGAAGLIKAALSLYNKVLPPTIKVTQPVEPLRAPGSPFYVNTTARPWLPRPGHPRRAGLSAFGFGGSNFHAILEEHSPNKVDPDWDGQVEILAISAATKNEITTQLTALPREWFAFAMAAEASRSSFQMTATNRLVIVASKSKPVSALIDAALNKLQSATTPRWALTEGVYFGSGVPAGGLAFVFPGQGSQKSGALRDLMLLFPEALETLAAANILSRPDEPRISDLLYPPTSFDKDAAGKNEKELTRTDRAQIALAATEFAAWRVLRQRFSISPDAYSGHSFGELTALAASGWISPVDFFRLAHLRGRLMNDAATGESTGMTAVLAETALVESLVSRYPTVVIANRNGPKQSVISGPIAALGKIEAEAQKRSITTVRLPVAAAFHSAAVSRAVEPFFHSVNNTTFSLSTIPVYSNTTAKPYPHDPSEARQLIGHQLSHPVRFEEQIRTMISAGLRTFVEIGPGSRLSRLINDIGMTDSQSSHDIECFALEPSAGVNSGNAELAQTLGRLAALGYAVDLSAWEKSSRCRPTASTAKPGLTVPISGANFKSQKPIKPATRAVSDYPDHSVENDAMPRSSGPGASMPNGHVTVLQDALSTLRRLQEQTAELHKQFLDSQMQAQQTIAALFSGQVPTPPSFVLPSVAKTPSEVSARDFKSEIPPPVTTPPLPIELKTESVPVPTTPPVGPPVVTSPTPNGTGGVSNAATVLLEVVSEKTGYPISTLDLSMSLDNDLGVDSIKRVEILSAIQDRLPDAPVVKPDMLGTLQTLNDVANYLEGPQPTTALTVPLSVLTASLTVPNSEIQKEFAASTNLASVMTVLMEIVSEKTGYPVGTLDPTMSMDHDLGIDSIKRVEILSSIQDRLPNAPVVKPDQLGSIQTLNDLANYLSGTPNPTTAKIKLLPNDMVTRTSESELTAPRTEPLNRIEAAKLSSETNLHNSPIRIKTSESTIDSGKPLTQFPVIDPIDRSILQTVDLDPTHVRPRLNFPAGRDVVIVGDESPLVRELSQNFKSLGLTVTLSRWNLAPTATIPEKVSALILVSPAKPPIDNSLNRLAFQWIQKVGTRIHAATTAVNPGLIACVTTYDGAFGLTGMAANADPQSGGLYGMIKTVRHEWTEVAAKAIDVDFSWAQNDPTSVAQAIFEECQIQGPIEIGLNAQHRCTIELARTVNRSTGNPFTLSPNDVILITGGARGVTSEASVAFAAASKGTIILTGRTPAATAPEPDWLASVVDEFAMKKAIAEHLGTGVTPKAVSEYYSRVVSQREIQETMNRIRAAGGQPFYYAVNVSNARAVSDLIHQVRVKHRRVTVLIHGAGVLADKRIESLSLEHFDTVFNTKADGARILLDFLRTDDLKAIIFFSSTTGRFGRVGQFAYAAANETLNKMAQIEAKKRPTCRVVSINWGPWEGGMVTSALKKIFEAEGIGLIPLKEGGQFAWNELSAPGRSVEVVAMGRLRTGTNPQLTPGPASRSGVIGYMGTQVPPPTAAPVPELNLSFERTVDVASHPILKSHVLDGRAVLPMAIHLEWLTHAALHGQPGMIFLGLDNLRITSGVQIEADGSVVLRALSGRAIKTDKHFVVPVEIRGKRKDGKEIIHSRADVLLTSTLPRAPLPDAQPELQPYPHPVDEVYKYFLFHGPDLQGIERIDGLTELAFVGTAFSSPQPAQWFVQPLRSHWVADPLVLDSCFQMLILWSFAQHGAGSLPCFVGRYRQYRKQFPAGPVKVVIRITRDNGTFARADIEFIDTDGQVIAQIQDYECVIDAQLNMSFRRNQLGGGVVRS